jgi:hypothetical protein
VEQSGIPMTTKTSRRGCFACGCLMILVGTFLIGTFSWFLIQPGIYSIQPIGALPDGVTFIYHSRNPDTPFFASPDGLCLKTQGSVTLLCRGVALAASRSLIDRIIVKLPFIRWAYLQSTGGLEFDR